MVPQTSGRPHHDMGAEVELAGFRAGVHAPDAGHNTRPGVCIEPVEFALHLHRKLTRGRDDQRQRLSGLRETFRFSKQRRRHRKSKGDRFPGAGLRRDQQIAPYRVGFENRELHSGRRSVAARRKSAPERGMNRREGHDCEDFSNGGSPPGSIRVAGALRQECRYSACLAGIRRNRQQAGWRARSSLFCSGMAPQRR